MSVWRRFRLNEEIVLSDRAKKYRRYAIVVNDTDCGGRWYLAIGGHDTNTVATIDISKDSVAQLADRVRSRNDRSSTDRFYSEKAMELLLKQRNFVGQSSKDVIGLIGPPDKILVANGRIWSTYEFAAGIVLWRFEVNAEDKVLKYVHEIRD